MVCIEVMEFLVKDFHALLFLAGHGSALLETCRGRWPMEFAKKGDLWVLQQLLVLHQLPIVVELVNSLSILGDHPWCNELLASMCL